MFLLFLLCGFLFGAIYLNYLLHQERAAEYAQASAGASLMEARNVAPSNAY